jgi:MFS family permease
MLDRRYGPKVPMLLGAVGGTAGYTLLTITHDQLWQIAAAGLLTGAGIGLVFAGMSNATIGAVPASQTGEASSVNSIMRTIGGSIGTAVIAAIIASSVTARSLPTAQGFSRGFAVCAGVGVLAIVAALLMPGASRRRAEAAQLAVDLGPITQ